MPTPDPDDAPIAPAKAPPNIERPPHLEQSHYPEPAAHHAHHAAPPPAPPPPPPIADPSPPAISRSPAGAPVERLGGEGLPPAGAGPEEIDGNKVAGEH